jgi:hypothetical protein
MGDRLITALGLDSEPEREVIVVVAYDEPDDGLCNDECDCRDEDCTHEDSQ